MWENMSQVSIESIQKSSWFKHTCKKLRFPYTWMRLGMMTKLIFRLKALTKKDEPYRLIYRDEKLGLYKGRFYKYPVF